MSGLRGRFKRSRVMACIAVAATALGVSAASSMAAMPNVKIVTQGTIPTEGVPKNTKYFSTIQAAVNSTKKGDWVLIEPGVYKEQVKVTQPNIHIRGMNRNSVILDGAGIPSSNGIEVLKTNNVWIENMTARNFENGPGGGGNDFWWSGGNDPGKVTARGWWGKYLTAYDTGLGGGYGIFAQFETEGSWDHIYASGFNDSGIYIGGCQQCKALVKEATIENNAVGYSGSNSGGELVIEKSRFAHNSDGIVPNGENPGDGPPPNNGLCTRRNGGKPNPTPSFTSTKIERCEILRYNEVTENNNLTVPANGSTIKSPYGAGIELPGDYAELIEHNTITKNPTDGILAFEYPNPYPPTEKTIYFELAGNKIANNTFNENGGDGGPYAGDLFMEGGIFAKGKSQSTMNCIGTGPEANSFVDATYPSQGELETTWGCQNETTPNPNLGINGIGWLIYLQEVSEKTRVPTPQAAPPAQETMPKPCTNVPVNPLCPNEEAEPYARKKKAHRKA